MNLRPFLLSVRDIKATLKCDIVGKEYNHKYLVVLKKYHCRFTFSVYLSLTILFSVFKLKFLSYSTSCEYDNMEVEE